MRSALAIGRRVLLAAVLVTVWLASDRPAPDIPPLFRHQDKVFHVAEFAVLGFSLALNRDLFGRRRPWLLLALAGLFWAGLDEVHQSWVPGRDCSALDFAADAVGLALWIVPAERLSARGSGTGGRSHG